MTSNLGSMHLKDQMKQLGFKTDEGKEKTEEDFEHTKEVILSDVKRAFRPEFINRIDEIIVFRPLSEENLKSIVKLLLKKVQEKLDQFHLTLDVSEKAEAHLIRNGSDFEYGARPLKRTIQKKIEDPLAELILQGAFKDKKTVHVDEKDEKELTFHAE